MADVCLFLEGTYPFVSGGVSGCVHQLVSMLPNTSFDLVFIGASSSDVLIPKYKIPPNVVSIQEVFLFDELDPYAPRERELSKVQLEALSKLHQQIHSALSHTENPIPFDVTQELGRSLGEVFVESKMGDPLLFQSLGSRGLWELLQQEYCKLGEEMPFVDFFYTWRSAHLPIYRMLSNRYPEAKVYHSLCTGYAGIAAVSAAVQHNAPLFVTEHGIYAHERAIELAEADWLYKKTEVSLSTSDVGGNLKRWWIELFRNLSRIAYAFSSEVITLYEGNRARQIRDGANPERTRIIPNGINRRFQNLRRKNPSWQGSASGKKFELGFIGRVVSIKDVKTLIKAVCLVHQKFPNVHCQIVGPFDEEMDYYKQCIDLVRFLRLENVVEFTGKKNITEVLPNIDCLLLTSISEAQPLVILEANCAGVPVVATQVGSCDDLLNGVYEEDRMLGPSGLIAPIGDAETIARQVLRLINEPETWEAMSVAGTKRVELYYDEKDLTAKYGVLYREHASRMAQVSGMKPGVLPWQG